MSFQRFGLLLALWTAVMALVASAAVAQAPAPTTPTVTVVVSSQRVLVGDPFQFEILIDGLRQVATPTLPPIDGATAEFAGASDLSSRLTTIINGRRVDRETERTSLQWRLTALREGVIEIPAVTLDLPGGPQTTKPQRVTATTSGEDPDFRFIVEPEHAVAYVGEPIQLKFTWYVGRQVTGAAISGPSEGTGYTLAAPPEKPNRPIQVMIQRGEAANLRFLDGEAILERGTGTLEGRTYVTYSTERIVTPTQPGKLTLGPYFVAYDSAPPGSQSTPLDFFGRPTNTQRRVLVSAPAVIEVKALPAAGRPSDFTGLVGRFSVKTETGVRQVSVGDPIPLTLTIKGPEPLSTVEAPDLALVPGFSDDFKLSPEGWDSRPGEPGERIYQTTLRARSSGVVAIPPLGLSYFDTEKERYERAQSEPLPLEVKATRQVTLGPGVMSTSTSTDAQSNAGGSGSSRSGGPRNAPPGVGANREGDLIGATPIGLLGFIQTPIGGLAVLAPAALLLAAIVYKHAQGRSSPSRTATLRGLRRRVQHARSIEEIDRALRELVALQIGIRPESVTVADAARVGSGSAAAGAHAAQQALARCEAARFADAAADLESTRTLALAAVDTAAGSRRTAPIVSPAAMAILVATVVSLAGQQARADVLHASLSRAEARQLVEQGAKHFEEATQAAARAEPLASKALLNEAIAAWTRVADSGMASASLEVNIANAALLAGDAGGGVLHYRRAQRMAPDDRDIRSGLAAARAQAAAGTPPGDVQSRHPTLLWWRGVIARPVLQGAFAFTWAAGLCWLAAKALGRTRRAWPGFAALGLSGLAAAPLVAEDVLLRTDTSAVVMVETAGLRGPAEGLYQPAFDAPLRPGTEVVILQTRGGWHEVALGDKRRTWVRAESIRHVDPRGMTAVTALN